MSDPLDLAAHDGALTPEERVALNAAVAADASLGEVVAHWRSVRLAVARELDEGAPQGELLALYALNRTAPEVLDDVDRTRLQSSRPALEEAFARHPALTDFAGRLEADAEAFEEVWDAQTGASISSPGDPIRLVVPEAPRALQPLGRSVDRMPVRHARVTPMWSRFGRIAAVLALVGLGAIAGLLLRRDAGLSRIVATEAMAVDLADGSSVELAAGSELLIPDTPERDAEAVSGDALEGAPRYARLVAGQALFRVARATEPFTVETPAASVTVLGTTFGVTSTGRTTDVVLVNGVVEVAARAGGPTVRLAPGESSRVVAGEGPAPAARADIDAALAWTGDVFIRAEPLAVAAARLGAALGVQIQVDSTLATEAVTGRFDRSEDAETTLRALALAVEARVEEVEGGFRLLPGTR